LWDSEGILARNKIIEVKIGFKMVQTRIISVFIMQKWLVIGDWVSFRVFIVNNGKVDGNGAPNWDSGRTL